MSEHKEPELYGLPDTTAAVFRPTLHDIDKFPRIAINLACAHMQVASFATAASLLTKVMESDKPDMRLEAAGAFFEMTIKNKAPVTPELFTMAGDEIDAACSRGNVQAMKMRHQLAQCNFDIKLG